MRNPFKKIITTTRAYKGKHPTKTIKEELNILGLYKRRKVVDIDTKTGSTISTAVTSESIFSNKRVHKFTMNCKTTTTITTVKKTRNQITTITDSDCSDTIYYEIRYLDNNANTIQLVTYEKNRANDCIEMDTFTCENFVYNDNNDIIYKNSYCDRYISDTDIYTYNSLGQKIEEVYLKSSQDLDDNYAGIINNYYSDNESEYRVQSSIIEYSNNSSKNYQEIKIYDSKHNLIKQSICDEKESISEKEIKYNIDGKMHTIIQNGKIVFSETYNENGEVIKRLNNNGITNIVSEYEYEKIKDEKNGKDRYCITITTKTKTAKDPDNEHSKCSVNRKIFDSKYKLLEDIIINNDFSMCIDFTKC